MKRFKPFKFIIQKYNEKRQATRINAFIFYSTFDCKGCTERSNFECILDYETRGKMRNHFINELKTYNF